MFEIPGSDVTAVHINEDVVVGRHAPIYTRNLAMDKEPTSNPSDNSSVQDEVMLEVKRRVWKIIDVYHFLQPDERLMQSVI